MIRVAVGILKRDDRLLVAKRPEGKPYSGYWEFPGGKIEAGESGAGALKRELREELGIDVIQAELLFTHRHTYPDKVVSLEMWLVTDFMKEPHGKENQELGWMTLNEMLKLRLLEGNWAMMDKIKLLFQEKKS